MSPGSQKDAKSVEARRRLALTNAGRVRMKSAIVDR